MKTERLVYRAKLLDKQLDELLKGDGRAAAAAVCAEAIIRDMAGHDVSSPELMHKQTKHGELRVKNCLKFDLGSGYRLVSLKQDNEIYFVFAGSHDDCHRWLENQRGSQINPEPANMVRIVCDEEKGGQEISVHDIEEGFDEYEERLKSRLDEKTLRYVFRGICGKD